MEIKAHNSYFGQKLIWWQNWIKSCFCIFYRDFLWKPMYFDKFYDIVTKRFDFLSILLKLNEITHLVPLYLKKCASPKLIWWQIWIKSRFCICDRNFLLEHTFIVIIYLHVFFLIRNSIFGLRPRVS